ncbi:MAG: sodium:solute symporter [Bacteroidota bacterium]
MENLNNGIATLDLVVIAIYFIVVLGIGLWIARKTTTGEDLFLGGRTFGWGIIGLSLFASNISTTTLIGLSGSAYSTGIVQSVYEWLSGVPLIVAAAIFVPLYLKSRITTIPEFLELRFDRRSRLFFSGITIFTSIVVDTAGGLYAGSLVLQLFVPDLVLWQTCFVLALVAGLYTAFGGLKAVVYTDAIQAVVLIIGCSVLTFLMFEQMNFDWGAVMASAPEDHFSVVRPLDDEGLPWTGRLLGVPFLGFWYWSTNQYIVQRVLGAKDIKNARGGVMLAGFLKIIPLFIMVIPGAMAISLLPGLENGDQVLPTAILTILPVGMVGLVLAGLIAAIMSSVDSTLNSASTLVVKDFIDSRGGVEPQVERTLDGEVVQVSPGGRLTEKQIVNYGRFTTVILMIVAAVWAPMIQNFSGIWLYLQQMFSIIVPPVVVVFLVGVFYPRGNGAGAFWTLVTGTGIGVVLFLLGQLNYWPFHFTTNVGLMVGVCTLLFIGFSQSTPRKENIDDLIYRPGLLAADEGATGLADWRVQAVLLTMLMGVLLVYFW